ncbi:MAG: ABC transporter ATP-binding protein [Pseudomonadota bacterium]|nr:ABC transporter ATP-binding protein [Pseudomonadota bacterium]
MTLELKQADVFYGRAQALHDVSLAVEMGGVVGLAGRNGAGKTTVLRTMAGQLKPQSGELLLDGKAVNASRPEELSRAGIAYVPADRQVFPTLTVDENLRIVTVAHQPTHWRESDIFRIFPRLAERRATLGGALSGGEQQMLTIARAMLCGPRYLLIDEPCEGLSPIMVEAVVAAMGEIASRGVGVVIVEQNLKALEPLVTRLQVLDVGRTAWIGDLARLERERSAVDALLSV